MLNVSHPWLHPGKHGCPESSSRLEVLLCRAGSEGASGAAGNLIALAREASRKRSKGRSVLLRPGRWRQSIFERFRQRGRLALWPEWMSREQRRRVVAIGSVVTGWDDMQRLPPRTSAGAIGALMQLASSAFDARVLHEAIARELPSSAFVGTAGSPQCPRPGPASRRRAPSARPPQGEKLVHRPATRMLRAPARSPLGIGLP